MNNPSPETQGQGKRTPAQTEMNMSEGKFTPGPWKVAGQGLDNEIEIVTTKLRGETVCVVLNDAEDVAVWPDAYLIAAAPELYEALAYALPIVEKYAHTQGDNAAFHAELTAPIRAALLKASGGSDV
jgi:hypothetical protein